MLTSFNLLGQSYKHKLDLKIQIITTNNGNKFALLSSRSMLIPLIILSLNYVKLARHSSVENYHNVLLPNL